MFQFSIAYQDLRKISTIVIHTSNNIRPTSEAVKLYHFKFLAVSGKELPHQFSITKQIFDDSINLEKEYILSFPPLFRVQIPEISSIVLFNRGINVYQFRKFIIVSFYIQGELKRTRKINKASDINCILKTRPVLVCN